MAAGIRSFLEFWLGGGSNPSVALSQTANVGLSGTLTVSADLTIASAGLLELGQAANVDITGTLSTSGDLSIETTFALEQTANVALSGTLTVSGDIESSTTPIVVPGAGIKPAGRPSKTRRRRKYVQVVDGHLVFTENAEQAIAWARLESAPQEPEKPQEVPSAKITVTPRPSPSGPRLLDIPQQQIGPSLEEISRIAAQYEMDAQYADMLRRQRYRQIAAMYEQLMQYQDDEDVMILAMA